MEVSSFDVDILQLRTSHQEIGVKTASALKERQKIHMLERITKDNIDYEGMKNVFTKFAPHLLEELEGIAQKLRITIEEAAALCSGYDVPRLEAMGCTAYVMDAFYVRNYDFSPDFYDGLFTVSQPERGYATAGYNLQGIGRHDGVNEKGLVVGLHFVSNVEYTKGLSAWVAVRIVLDTCSSVKEAIHLLKQIPHAACYNFSLGDSKEAAVVEASPNGVAVRKGLELVTCFNNFKVTGMEEKNRPSIEGSLKRDRYLQTLENKHVTHDQVYSLFSNPDSPLFFTEYDQMFGTLHTFSYSFSEERIVTSIARGKKKLDFRFPDWMRGQDIEQRRLYGAIESGRGGT